MSGPTVPFLDELGQQLIRGRQDLFARRRRMRRAAIGSTVVAVLAFVYMANAGPTEQSDTLTVASDTTITARPTTSDDTIVPVAETSPGTSSHAQVQAESAPLPNLFGLRQRGGHSLTAIDTGFLVWGGWDGGQAKEVFADGVIIDNQGNLVRAIASAPEGRGFHDAYWNGTEVLIVGGFDALDIAATTILAYNPSSDQWRHLANLPPTFNPTSQATLLSAQFGTGLIVLDRLSNEMAVVSTIEYPGSVEAVEAPDIGFIGALRSTGSTLFAIAGDRQDEPTLVAVLTDDLSWELAPPVQLGDGWSQASASVGGKLAVWSRRGSEGSGFLLNPETMTWTDLAPPPLAACEGSGTPIHGAGQSLILDLCGQPDEVWFARLVYADGTASWSKTGPIEGHHEGPSAIDNTTLVHLGYCCGRKGTDDFHWSLGIARLD